MSDHRIDLTLHKPPQVIEGEALGEIIEALMTEHQAELLAAEERSDERSWHPGVNPVDGADVSEAHEPGRNVGG